MRRRELLYTLPLGAVGLLSCAREQRTSAQAPPIEPPAPTPTAPPNPPAPPKDTRTRVALVRDSDRARGITRAVALLGLPELGGKKPNFNSEHATPGSSHEQTLQTLLKMLTERGANVTLGDRSGMAVTREAMETKDVFKLAKKYNTRAIVFDELAKKDWRHATPRGGHLSRGIYLPSPFLDADFTISTCCLKTHRFGGHFTMALKNSVGLVADRLPGTSYRFMRELHRSDDKRLMMAEINTCVSPDLIVLDGVEAFVNGGPEDGDRARGDLILAGTDPVAIDALAVAMLRKLGTTKEVSTGPIHKLDQIRQALSLNLGTADPTKINILTDDAPSRALANTLLQRLRT